MKEYKIMLEKLKNKNIDVSKLYIYACLICSFEWCNPMNKFMNLEEKTQTELIDFVYNAWLKADHDISISLISDKVAENYKDIINNKLNYYEILDKCYEI